MRKPKEKRAKKTEGKAVGIVELIVAHLKARDLGRIWYGRADRALEDIAKRLKPGKEVVLPNGDKAVLKDNFADTNKVFRHHGIARFEIDVTEH